VLLQLHNCVVKDILIAFIDGLTGFTDAIAAIFPKTKVQKCIIHQIHKVHRFKGSREVHD
jgi:transposase-like protein